MKHIEKKVIDLTLPVTALIGVNKLIQIQKKNDLMNYNTSVNKFELENCSSFPSFVHSFYIRCSNSFPYFGTKVVIISYRGSEVRRTSKIKNDIWDLSKKNNGCISNLLYFDWQLWRLQN
jgi:hypothetical protein